MSGLDEDWGRRDWWGRCPECERRGELLLAALELIEPEYVTEIGKLARDSWWRIPRRHGGMIWYGHPSWPSMSYIDPVVWFE